MDSSEMTNVKDLLMKASMEIAKLASSLDHYVQDDNNPEHKKLFEEQVRDANEFHADIDDLIALLTLGQSPF
ncbi:hypothetical protein X753_19810 [Mesorhizobium sp. LNJC399B00]|uniref:hypothetical protein n=1 Tax=unclassified Mesorhizobium TaxID=325217 RepID=UPI0003CF7F78|nr:MULTISPECIES: hypothetical protein [unclassified Mesorhizobium]ESY03817.1 hypothetical protein X753_19810 [Mesorhizobium sp. LNJC399B00]WJI67238.1 hypothetical protein NLY36_20320 [Mesorhizobium sp. C399B]